MNILLGVTSGIAAYKIPNLIRLLTSKGHKVRVILSPKASFFITETVIYTLTKTAPYKDLFPEKYSEDPMYHISLSDWADILAIVPATANTIGKLAHGIADNLLTTTALAFSSRKIIFPAMNTNMWLAPPVQDNLKQLEKYGWIVVPPDNGELACGISGPGRLPKENYIARVIETIGLYGQDLKGLKIAVTAGATREYIDAVRFISNASSGKMGYELAASAHIRGAEVTLFAPALPEDIRVTHFYPFVSTKDLVKLISEKLSDIDYYISAAAISDFSPHRITKNKIKKEGRDNLTLELKRTPDLLSLVKNTAPQVKRIGFSLETDNIIENAQKKLKAKKLELIVANTPNNFGTEHGDFIFISKNGTTIEKRNITKFEAANFLLNQLKAK